MKRSNIIKSFELEINKLDDDLKKPVTEDSLYWLNQGIAKFTKLRFNGAAPHYTSYEQTEKRTRDLHNLVKRVQVNNASASQLTDMTWLSQFDTSELSTQVYLYPEDLMYVLDEDVILIDKNGNSRHTAIFECTLDSFMFRVTNSLTDFHIKHKKARPLRVKVGRTANGLEIVLLLNDTNYAVDKLFLSYLKTPQQLDSVNPTTDPEYNDFEDDVWYEIIKIAAQMYVENQQEQRYNTLTAEVLTQE